MRVSLFEVSRRESVLKNYFYRLVKKIPDARRARNRSFGFIQDRLRGGVHAQYEADGVFQRPVLFTTVHVDYRPANKSWLRPKPEKSFF